MNVMGFSLFGSLLLSSLPVHPVQDHWEPEEYHECDHQDCPSAQLQARRRAVGAGDTCEGEREEETDADRTLGCSFIWFPTPTPSPSPSPSPSICTDEEQHGHWH